MGQGQEKRVVEYEYVRDLVEPSESVWKVAFTKETCVVAYKRAGKTWVEMWSFRARRGDEGR